MVSSPSLAIRRQRACAPGNGEPELQSDMAKDGPTGIDTEAHGATTAPGTPSRQFAQPGEKTAPPRVEWHLCSGVRPGRIAHLGSRTQQTPALVCFPRSPISTDDPSLRRSSSRGFSGPLAATERNSTCVSKT